MKSGFRQIDAKCENFFENGRMTMIESIDENVVRDMMVSTILNLSIPDFIHGSRNVIDVYSFDDTFDIGHVLSSRIGENLRPLFSYVVLKDLSKIENPLVIYALDELKPEMKEILAYIKAEARKNDVPVIFFRKSESITDYFDRQLKKESAITFMSYDKVIDAVKKSDGFSSGTIRSIVLYSYSHSHLIRNDYMVSYEASDGSFTSSQASDFLLKDVKREILDTIGEIGNTNLKTLLLDICGGIERNDQQSFMLMSESMLSYSLDVSDNLESARYREFSLRLLLIGLLIDRSPIESASLRRLFAEGMKNLLSTIPYKKKEIGPFKDMRVNVKLVKEIMSRYDDEMVEPLAYEIFISLRIENTESRLCAPLIRKYRESKLSPTYRNKGLSTILNSIAVALFFRNDQSGALYFWNEALRHNENDVDASYNLYLFYKQGYSICESREKERKYYERYMKAASLS